MRRNNQHAHQEDGTKTPEAPSGRHSPHNCSKGLQAWRSSPLRTSRANLPLAGRIRQVARALRDFTPDATTVWLKEKEGGGPYLELLDPGAGILLIEAPHFQKARRKRRPRWRAFSEQDIVRIRDDIAEWGEDLRKRIDRALMGSLPVECILAAPEHDEVPVVASLGPSTARSTPSSRQSDPQRGPGCNPHAVASSRRTRSGRTSASRRRTGRGR